MSAWRISELIAKLYSCTYKYDVDTLSCYGQAGTLQFNESSGEYYS